MIKIEIPSNTVVKPKQGTARATGKPYSFREQTAFAHLPDKAYPVECKVVVDDGDTVYPPGFYTLAPSSVYVDRFGGLALSARLAPVK